MTPTTDAPKYLLGMPEADYFSHSALSASQMKLILHSPKHFQLAPRVEKRVYEMGHAIHARIFGVGQEAVQIPSHLLTVRADGVVAISKQEAKDWVAKQKAEGKTPLKPAEYRKVVDASDAVLKHPTAGPLLAKAGHREVSMFGTDPETGVRLRGRADAVTEDGEILDLKWLRDISLRAIIRDVNSYSYDLSMENYRFLYELTTGTVAQPAVLICVEKEPPYDVRVVRLTEEWQDGGWRKMREAIRMFAECTTSGVWPGVGDEGILDLPAPSWYAAENERAELELVGA
ncbi:PD-(D/E)XK nuclease-like domain-containing protein [Microbacterium trichothecenolyticum]|uniref:PD-(D/E)XK nuclease-like domain-containing protein n=1 Tax=Microbacterium trichothecenolyticum TaxID=69370 RepID=UPI0035BE69B8